MSTAISGCAFVTESRTVIIEEIAETCTIEASDDVIPALDYYIGEGSKSFTELEELFNS